MKELTLQETQNISLDILSTIADICEKNKYRYCLIYGTLIGAVRHHGFIPWDDDLDIMMPRKDYENLLAYLQEHTNDYAHLRVFNPDVSSNYPYMITRISNDNYVIQMENEKPYGMGVFIDIYPYDGMGNTFEEALSYGLKGDRLSSMCYQATRAHFAMETTVSIWRKILKFPAFCAAKLIGKNYFQNQLKKLAAVKDYDTSEYVGCVVWLSGGARDIFPRAWFDELVLTDFCNKQFWIPKHYDQILTHIYGNYMQLPPENERTGHHNYKVFQKRT